MLIRLTRLALLSSLFVVTALLTTVQAQEAELSYKTTKLAEGLFMIEGVGGFVGGNMSLSMGKDGVVLIDDGVPPLTGRLMAEIGKLTKDPVKFLINTHAHGDHVGGNEAFGKQGAIIVAHDNLRQRLIDKGMPAPDGSNSPVPKVALPVVTFADAVTFHLNGREAFVFHVEHAHTDGDAVIHFPKDNVIHAGDAFFNGLFPFIDLDSGGTVEGYIQAQKRIWEMADDKTQIVPGHGPLANKQDLKVAIDMLVTGYSRVRDMVKSGKSEEEILTVNPLKEFHDKWNWQFISTERMTKTLIRAAGDS